MAILLFQDVIEQITFYLQRDRFSLARLRLISHAWDAPCRALLFYRIELRALDPLDYLYVYGDAHPHGPNDMLENATQDLLNRCNTLLELFRARPCLGDVPKEIFLTRAHRLKPSIWGTLEPAYTKVLEQLGCIRKVHLHEVHFSHLSKEFLGALLGVCRQPSVIHYNLVNCPVDDGGLLKEVILAPPFLKHLGLSGAPSRRNGQAKTPSDPQQSGDSGGESTVSNELTPHTGNSCDLTSSSRGRVQLETLALELGSALTFVEHLLHSATGMDLSELKEFRLGHVDNTMTSPVDVEALETVIRACASTVEFVDVGAPSGRCRMSKEEIRGSAEMFCLPRLRTIRFSGTRFTEGESIFFALNVVQCLSTISPASELRAIEIQGYSDTTVGDDIDWECWQQIDEILSDRKSFPFFGALTISLSIMDRGRADALVSQLKQQLSTILGRGYLSVSVTF